MTVVGQGIDRGGATPVSIGGLSPYVRWHHANVVRGNPAGTPWPTAVPAANPVECDYRPVAGAVDNNMTTFPVSTNSLDEYRASNFEGAMAGDIIAVGLNPPAVYRVELSADGQSVTANTTLFSGLSGRHLGLDVLDDDEIFPGTIWVGEFTSTGIVVFEPNDYDTPPPVCTGADDPALDDTCNSIMCVLAFSPLRSLD